MPTLYHSLPTEAIFKSQPILHPETNQRLSTEEPAIAVMMDFASVAPNTVDSHLSVAQAQNIMKTCHLPFQLVVNAAEEFVGIVTLKSIMGKKAMATANEMGLALGDLIVRDIMQPCSRLKSLHLRYLKRAKIGDVLETLAKYRADFLLVVDDREEEGKTLVRGLISAQYLARVLGVEIDYSDRPASFSDFVHAFHGHFD